MSQSRTLSLVEAITNVAVGYGLAVVAQLLVFPVMGLGVTPRQTLAIGLVFTAVWEVFEAERSSLIPYVGPFDGFHAVPASVSKTCLVRFDKNRYSVDARAVGRPVEIKAYADRLEC